MTTENLEVFSDGLRAVIDTAQDAAQPHTVGLDDADSAHFVVLRPGEVAERLDTDDLQPYPRRKTGEVVLTTAAAFSSYVTKHSDEDETSIFADVESRRIVAVLDDHGGSVPGWGEHRAVLTLRHTPEWLVWAKADEKPMGQVEFAEMIEDRLVDVVEPVGADLLEVIREFHATTKATFRSAVRLDNGEQQLTWVEEVEARSGKQGDLTVPGEFVLGLAVFEGEDHYRVTARLRYRVREGRLTIGYVLSNREDVIRDSFRLVTERIADDTGLYVYEGTPRGTGTRRYLT